MGCKAQGLCQHWVDGWLNEVSSRFRDGDFQQNMVDGQVGQDWEMACSRILALWPALGAWTCYIKVSSPAEQSWGEEARRVAEL